MRRNLTVAILIALIIAYTAVFSFVAYAKYRSFSFYDVDLAVINQAFWNASRGGIVPASPGQATILNGGHVELIILLLTPIYAAFPSPLTLLFLQSLALAVGAWPLYLLGRELVKPAIGLLFAVCYLIYPALNWVNLFEFHTIALATPLILWMFYFYVRKNWPAYCLFVILALSCREDVAIPVFAMGIFALIRGRGGMPDEKGSGLKWGLLVLFSSVIWFVLCIKFIQPYFMLLEYRNAETAKGGLLFFGWLGDSLSEILRTLAVRPGYVLGGIVIKAKMLYLLHLLAPVTFLPLFSPAGMVMTLLSLSEGLLSQRIPHYTIRYQYTSIVTPIVFIAAIYGIRNIFKIKALARRESSVYMIVLIVSLFSAWFLGPLPGLPREIKSWRFTEEDAVRQKMVDAIQKDAAACTTFRFSAKLSMRPMLFHFYHIYAQSQHTGFGIYASEAQRCSKYLILDFDDPLTFYDFYTHGGDADIYRFLTGGNWELVEAVNSLALFKRGERPQLGLVRTADCREAAHMVDVTPVADIKLCGYTLKKGMALGEHIIALDVYCQRLRASSANYFIAARFTSRRDPGYSFEQVLFAPFRIYPSSRWRDGEVVVQRCNILIPRRAPYGEYDMKLTLCREDELMKTIMLGKRGGTIGWIAYAGAKDLILP